MESRQSMADYLILLAKHLQIGEPIMPILKDLEIVIDEWIEDYEDEE